MHNQHLLTVLPLFLKITVESEHILFSFWLALCYRREAPFSVTFLPRDPDGRMLLDIFDENLHPLSVTPPWAPGCGPAMFPWLLWAASH